MALPDDIRVACDPLVLPGGEVANLFNSAARMRRKRVRTGANHIEMPPLEFLQRVAAAARPAGVLAR